MAAADAVAAVAVVGDAYGAASCGCGGPAAGAAAITTAVITTITTVGVDCAVAAGVGGGAPNKSFEQKAHETVTNKRARHLPREETYQ